MTAPSGRARRSRRQPESGRPASPPPPPFTIPQRSASPMATLAEPAAVAPLPPTYGTSAPWRQCVEIFGRPLPLFGSVLRREAEASTVCHWVPVVLHVNHHGDVVTVSDQPTMQPMVVLAPATDVYQCCAVGADEAVPIAPPALESAVFCIARAGKSSHLFFSTAEESDRQAWLDWLWTAFPHTQPAVCKAAAAAPRRGSDPSAASSASSALVRPRAVPIFGSSHIIAAF